MIRFQNEKSRVPRDETFRDLSGSENPVRYLGIKVHKTATKNIPSFLNTDPLLYAGFIQLYRRGTVRVLEKRADGVFIQDTHGISYMLATADAKLAASWLKKHASERIHSMMVIGADVAGYAQRAPSFPERMDVYQADYNFGYTTGT